MTQQQLANLMWDLANQDRETNKKFHDKLCTTKGNLSWDEFAGTTSTPGELKKLLEIT